MFIFIKIILIIMPLKVLKNKQCKKLKKIINYKPFVLNGDSNKFFNFTQIRRKIFIHDKFKILIVYIFV